MTKKELVEKWLDKQISLIKNARKNAILYDVKVKNNKNTT